MPVATMRKVSHKSRGHRTRGMYRGSGSNTSAGESAVLALHDVVSEARVTTVSDDTSACSIIVGRSRGALLWE